MCLDKLCMYTFSIHFPFFFFVVVVVVVVVDHPVISSERLRFSPYRQTFWRFSTCNGFNIVSGITSLIWSPCSNIKLVVLLSVSCMNILF